MRTHFLVIVFLIRYEYLALLDIDEVIVPIKHNSWAEMMEEVLKASQNGEVRASWNFRNVYFMDEMTDLHEQHQHFADIPSFLHMLQHVYRSGNYTKKGQYVKSFHNPEKVWTVHNHYPLACIGGGCGKSKSFNVETDLGHLQHYRSDCVSALKKSCEEDFKSVSVFDSTIWRWKEPVIEKTTGALLKLGFLVRQNNTVPNLVT